MRLKMRYGKSHGSTHRAPFQFRGSLGALFDAFSKSLHWARLALRTRKDYEAAFDWLAPRGGDARLRDAPLSDLSAHLIVAVRDRTHTVRGFRFATHMLSALSIACEWAREQGWINANPWYKVPRVKRPKSLRQANRGWELDEINAVLAAASATAPQLVLPIMIARYTGMRQGDVLALSVDCWDGKALRWRASKARRKLRLSRRHESWRWRLRSAAVRHCPRPAFASIRGATLGADGWISGIVPETDQETGSGGKGEAGSHVPWLAPYGWRGVSRSRRKRGHDQSDARQRLQRFGRRLCALRDAAESVETRGGGVGCVRRSECGIASLTVVAFFGGPFRGNCRRGSRCAFVQSGQQNISTPYILRAAHKNASTSNPSNRTMLFNGAAATANSVKLRTCPQRGEKIALTWTIGKRRIPNTSLSMVAPAMRLIL